MCFSAEASFTTSSILVIIGALTVRKAQTQNQYMFAAIPLLFAIQQSAEGIIWLTFDNAKYISLYTTAIYVFLVFTYIVWPTWIPLSITFLEHDNLRKRMLSIISLGGMMFSVVALVLITKISIPVSVKCNIIYDLLQSSVSHYTLVLYALITITPFFISTARSMKLFGVLLILSLGVTFIFWYKAFTSVWCFFAAVISVFVWKYI